MRKDKKLYEGKTKRLYTTDNPDLLIQEFKHDAVAANGAKSTTVKGKGVVNNRVSAHLFRYLESYHVPTHFVKSLSDTEMLVKRLDIIPVEVVVRNVAVGSLGERFGVEQGEDLPHPVVEYYLKDDERHDPMLNEDHVVAFGHASGGDLGHIRRTALKINVVLRDFFLRRNLKLLDVKLEFGRAKGKILVGDEISLDTCRLQDLQSGQRLDRDYLVADPVRAEQLYQDFLVRVLGQAGQG
ncbi:MAG: phosphoribosylaminoimidazolesuccinocarboxamide synthase [candidate division KSB1 bacterium]|nr:phosphoribosylaminoimidazolesuccinocarboxamide synthase [candidate division KSB1 bacterium]MDZ7337326.1 phosphoribosylaminoimidazolesuccinocarboxamide synthase [candidate division KSB1 bacterium]MDZ7386708.1 phosphoribosylaminoimidazolesuccinocarboxamide synthase [candidate division KSB1 bacterium]MDZ7393778.1 phosphoribosylaminoimidazolesuccinocarboxamide synthase [candidate division KSB1 bacterium]MDZ7414015.1 phosphoribosylaminoimidazolesuccinocarboxamide synthase [candidate division KSB1